MFPKEIREAFKRWPLHQQLHLICQKFFVSFIFNIWLGAKFIFVPTYEVLKEKWGEKNSKLSIINLKLKLMSKTKLKTKLKVKTTIYN